MGKPLGKPLILAVLALPPIAGTEEKAQEVDLSRLITIDYHEGVALPAEITKLDGERVLIRGFMDPSQFTPDKLHAFRLTSDACGCSGKPLVHHFVDVTLADGMEVDYNTGMVELEGTLGVGELKDEEDFVLSVYRLECDTVR